MPTYMRKWYHKRLITQLDAEEKARAEALAKARAGRPLST